MDVHSRVFYLSSFLHIGPSEAASYSNKHFLKSSCSGKSEGSYLFYFIPQSVAVFRSPPHVRAKVSTQELTSMDLLRGPPNCSFSLGFLLVFRTRKIALLGSKWRLNVKQSRHRNNRLWDPPPARGGYTTFPRPSRPCPIRLGSGFYLAQYSGRLCRSSSPACLP